jgi:ankyrin repeat protein
MPLYWAMSIGSIELCELLLFHGASIKRSDAFGKKLLLSILDDEQIGDFYRLNHQKLVNKRTSNTALTPTKTPLKSNFFPKATISSAKNNNSFTSFSEVIPVVQQRNVDLLEPYLERIGSTEVMLGPNGNTLLHLAVLVPDNVHIIRTLLKREAPIDAVNQRKQTPLLLLAAQPFCSLSNLMCLLENGADVTHQDHFGSALHYAIKFGSLAAIELLLSYNADPTATSISGLKAVDFAFQENATAYKLICNKLDDKQNNQQAMLGHEIIEDTLTTLDGSIKFGSWHIVLMLMDRAIKHQGHYQGYLSLLTEKDVQHSSTIKIFGDLLSEVQGPIVTSFASLGALTAIELALYYKNLCLSYFDYLFDLAPEEELERALVFNLSCLHSPVTPDLRQPDQNHTLNTEIMDDLFTHKIEEIQSKEAKYITHYSERFLADLLIARWRVRCSSTNVERQKQAAADFQQGCEIYQQLVSQCSNLPRKISLLIALHSCKPDDAQVQVEYAKTAVKLNNRNIQASAYRLIFKSDRSISDPVLIAKKLAEIVIQGSSIPYNNHSILDSKNIRSEIK